MPEVRFEAKAETVAVLDAYCSASWINPTAPDTGRSGGGSL